MDDVPVSVIALLGFLGVVVIVLSVMHFYLWRRLVRSTTVAGSRSRRLGRWLLVGAMVSTVAAQVSTFLLPPGLAIPLAWVGFSWLGFAFYLVLFLLVGDLVRLGVWLLRRRSESAVEATNTADPVPAEAVPAAAGSASRLPLAERDVRASALDSASDTDRTNDVVGTDGPGRTDGFSGTDGASGTPGASRPTGDDSGAVTRRLFLSRSIAVGAGIAAASVGGYGITRAMGDPLIRRVPVQIAGLDPAFAGFRITMFADAHLGSIRRKAVMERLVDLVNSTEPDLVAVVGDLIDGSVAELGGDVAPMAGLQSPNGTFFVTGNHEYYSGVEEWAAYLPDLGVRVLRNERAAIEQGGAAFDLAGVNDITGDDYDDSPDYDQALGGRSNRPVILLCHQPINVDRAVEFGVDLQLSGHTHGGQLWPFHYIVALQQGSASGLSRIGNTQLYVDSGVGFWGPPMRVGADPEITVIELEPADAEG